MLTNASDPGDLSDPVPIHEVRLFADYPDGLLHFAAAFCIIYTVIGIPGNLITIAALSRYKKVHNATAIFIINLSVSDLLLCCFNLPLSASLFINRAWIHSPVWCMILPILRYGLVAVSLFTILAITINRYVIIGHPNLYCRVYQPKYLALMIAAIWASAFIFLVPTMTGRWGHFGLDTKIGSCTILPNEDGSSPKDFLFGFAFLLPAVAFCVCYARIFIIVRRAERMTRPNLARGQAAAAPKSAPACPSSQVKLTAETSLAGTEITTEVKVTQPAPPATTLAVPAPVPELSSDNVSDAAATAASPPADKKRKQSQAGQLIGHLTSALREKSHSRDTPRQAGRMSSKDKKLLRMILVIFVSFVLCYLPITMAKVLGKDTDAPVVNVLGYVFIYLTTCTNPVIYVAMSSEYRKAYKHLLTCNRNSYGPTSNHRSTSRI